MNITFYVIPPCFFYKNTTKCLHGFGWVAERLNASVLKTDDSLRGP